jgi:uncharacterized protein
VIFHAALVVVAFAAGVVASVTGFGIGSLLTPLLASRWGTPLAVAAVSIPHLAATALRCWLLSASFDRRVLLRFGATSAAGGLLGALLQSRLGGPQVTVAFGAVLALAGITGVTGLSQRLRFGRKTAWAAGALSGFFGGLVGNQGGIRSAALLGFDVDRQAFVATATAVGVIVDGARMPVYAFAYAGELAARWAPIAAATAAAVAGTLLGARLLRGVPESAFRRLVSAFVLLLGVYMLVKGLSV